MPSTDSDQVVLEFADKHITVPEWTAYTINSDFMTPTDAWSFTIGGGLADVLRLELQPGNKIRLLVNGLQQMTGLIDKIAIRSDRDSGTVLRIEGRDILGPAVDGHVDPRLQFSQQMTFADVIRKVLEPYGISRIETDDIANRNAITGGKKGKRLNKPRPAGHSRRRRNRRGNGSLINKKWVGHLLKPYPSEGSYEFAERVAARAGLHIFVSADGEYAIADEPDFDQAPSYDLIHRRAKNVEDATNVLEADAHFDWSEQPAIVVATGRGAGGPFSRSTLRTAVLNQYVAVDPRTNKIRPEIAALIKELGVDPIVPGPDWNNSPVIAAQRFYNVGIVRPMFFHDDTSQTLEELEFFAMRRMAQYQHRLLTYRCTVFGHTQDDVPWATNTIANVKDEACGIDEPMWIKSRTFRKDRMNGTTTELELIRPWTLVLGDYGGMAG